MTSHRIALSLLAFATFASAAHADTVQVRVTVQSLASANGVALSPFTVAFHDGSFNAFTTGSAANVGVQNIAESGNGTAYLSAFNSAYAHGVSGAIIATTNGFGPGIYLPTGWGSQTFTLDTAQNGYFNFGAMVVPSNDRFVGNAAGIKLLDGAGNLLVSSITLHGSDIWDAGTEVDGPFGAAFLAGQNGGDHTAQNGVITSNHDYSPYAGLLTAAGYNFTDLPGADTAIARISFEVVPTPTSLAAFGAAGLLATRRRAR